MGSLEHIVVVGTNNVNNERNCAWPKVRLGDYIDLLTGYPFKSSQYCDDPDSIPLLRGDNIAQGFLRWDGVKRWPSSQLEGFEKFVLERDDIILAMDRPWIEAGLKYAWVNEKDLPCLLVQRVARLRGKNGLLTKYLRYVIADQSFTDYIKPIVTGVAVPHISGKQIQDYRFSLPPLPTQRRIAAILSAYDDLIDNNTRRIKILEEMAQALYREWFVHFRFPGHEKVPMVDSPLGRIPEGWTTAKFTDIADVLSGGTPRTTIPEFWNGNIPFFTLKDAASSFYVLETEKNITEKGLEKCNSYLYPKNTVFITARGTIGKIVMPAMNMAMNQSCYALKGKNGFNQYYIFLSIKNCIDQLRQSATGAVFDTIIIDTFRKLEVIKPSKQTAEAFNMLVDPLFDQILNILYRNSTLRCTRDLLLPKLISGWLNIEAIEIETEVKNNDRSISQPFCW